MAQRELQALTVSMRTSGGNRVSARSMAPPASRHTAFEVNFPITLIDAPRSFQLRPDGRMVRRVVVANSRVERTQSAGDDPIDASRPILRAEDLSHRVGHAGNGQQPANLRIVAGGVQVAQQERRRAQVEKQSDDRAKLAAPLLVARRGQCGSAGRGWFDRRASLRPRRRCDSPGRRKRAMGCSATTRRAAGSPVRCRSPGNANRACSAQRATPNRAACPTRPPDRAFAMAADRELPRGRRNRGLRGTWPRAAGRARPSRPLQPWMLNVPTRKLRAVGAAGQWPWRATPAAGPIGVGREACQAAAITAAIEKP